MSIYKLISRTRYLVLIPIIALAIMSAAMFIFGSVRLVSFIIEGLLGFGTSSDPEVFPIAEVVEFVHQFLVGTVLYITAIGLYQLFIRDVELPEWLEVRSIEELETNLIGMTVVVLAVNFLGIVFTDVGVNILDHGIGIGVTIAALSFFIAVRTWSERNKSSKHAAQTQTDPDGDRQPPDAAD